MEFLKKKFQLPSKDEMLTELDNENKELLSNGLRKNHAHMMGSKQQEYYTVLSSIADIKSLPPVMAKIHIESTERFADDLINFREEVFKIVDDNTFVKIK